MSDAASLERRNPFPGLRPFETADGGLFFGRDRHIEDLLERLRTQRFLGVVGTSGSGKSSLVRAGLVPALYEGFLTSSGSEWRIGIMRPGEDPIDALAAELTKREVLGLAPELASTLDASSEGLVEAALRAGLQKSENLLIVVDQFEELFRYPNEKAERAVRFVERLLAASATERASIYVILTMRSDYLGDCARFSDLAEKLNGGQYLIPRLSRDELHEAIEGPVLVGGASITPALVEELLNDSGSELDQLPLLQHTLSRIWEIWSVEDTGTPIDIRHYRDKRIQSMKQALDLSATAALAELQGDDNQRIARLLFRRITDRTSGKRDTRRPTKVREILDLTRVPLESLQRVYDHFARTGVNFLQASPGGALTADSILDISHETLIANWSTLRQWAEQEADFSREYRRLTHAARAKDSFFVTTVRSYLQWQVNLLADLCGNFPGGKVPWQIAGGLALYAPWAFVLRLISKRTLQELPNQIANYLLHSLARMLGGLADPASSPLPVWAARYSYGDESFRQAFDHLYRQYRNAGLRLITYYLAVIAVILAVGYVFQERQSAQQKQVALQAQEWVSKANDSFANDLPSSLSAAVKSIEVTQSAKQEPVIGALEALKRATLAAPARMLQGHSGFIRHVAWSPDGKRLATAAEDGRIGIWNPLSGNPVAMSPLQGDLLGLAWKPDGSEIVVAGEGGEVERWKSDLSSRSQLLTTLQRRVAVVSLSRQGDWLAGADNQGYITVFHEQGAPRPLGNTPAPVRGWTAASTNVRILAWHPSLPRLAAAYYQNDVEIWDADRGAKMGTIPVGASPRSVSWDDSGRWLVTGAQDWSARVFDITLHPSFAQQQVGPPLGGHKAPVTSVAWGHKTASSDRSGMLATGSLTVKVFRISADGKHELVAELGHYDGAVAVYALDWSPDNRLLAAGTTDSRIYLYPLDVLDARSADDWLAAARGRLQGLRGH